MLRVETDSANIPPARNPNHCLEAVTLVLKHPGCTLGELVSLTLAEDEQGMRWPTRWPALRCCPRCSRQ
jgi:hypothetical protein